MEKEKILKILKMYKIHIGIITGIICVFLLFILLYKEEDIVLEENITEIKKEEKEKITKYFVDIKGAVVNPNVYEIEKGARIKDVVTKAGGFKENANTEYINLGKKITDEMIIIIYTNEEIKEYIEGNKTIQYVDKTCRCPTVQNDGCIEKGKTYTNKKENEAGENKIVNINIATKEELETLPSIGSSKAIAIIEYRKKTPFTKVEDIKNVKGIGDSIFDKIKDYITI